MKQQDNLRVVSNESNFKDFVSFQSPFINFTESSPMHTIKH